MSLINEALKKAQNQRAEGSAVDYQSATATGPRRGRPPKGPVYVMLGSGAVVLVVLSVVATVSLVNRSNHPVAASASPANSSPAASVSVNSQDSTRAGAASTSPSNDASRSGGATFVVPGLTPKKETTTEPVSSAPDAAAGAAASATRAAPIVSSPVANASKASSATASSSAVTPGSAAAPATNAPVPAAPTLGPGSFDQQVAAFVEAIRVTGIRSSGNESRVLMNERVYRVNDIVERSLGVKLIKVAADTLTFVDANGVTYEKHF